MFIYECDAISLPTTATFYYSKRYAVGTCGVSGWEIGKGSPPISAVGWLLLPVASELRGCREVKLSPVVKKVKQNKIYSNQ